MAELVKIVAPVLEWNPRRIKQFINGFRLHAYVASDLGLLDIVTPNGPAENSVRLTLEQLGKFIAITNMWPDLVMDLLIFPKLLSNIYRARINVEESARASVTFRQLVSDIPPLEMSLIDRWCQEKLLLNLLTSKTSGEAGWRYSLEKPNLRLLLNISRRENRIRRPTNTSSTVSSWTKISSPLPSGAKRDSKASRVQRPNAV